MRDALEASLLDVVGLCVAARDADYLRAAAQSWDAAGPCTALGHADPFDAAGAAFVNGTAAHGEDYDDTFEGTPVHTGAVIVPAVLAVCERHGLSGRDALRGAAAGTELMCRAALVAPTAIHRAGFSPDRGHRRAGRGGRDGDRAAADRASACRCAGYRGQPGVRHHRISGGR